MKKLINKSAFFAAFAAALTLFAGCEKMPGLEPLSRSIKVNVLISRDSGTKADARPQLVDVIQSESGDMILEEYVSDYPEYSSPVFTKGAAITTDAYNPITGKTFYVEGWLGEDIEDPVKGKDAETADKNDYHFIKKNSVSFDGESWSISGENFWRNGIPTTFWSYVPPTVGTLEIKWPGATSYGGSPFTTYASPDKPGDTDQEKISFTYSLPAPGAGGTGNDAYNLQDFLFAYNKETCSFDKYGELTDGQEYININFHHPLAAVKFDVGSLNGSSNPSDWDYVNITKIELIDVSKSGSFLAEGSGANSCLISCNASGTDKGTYVQDNLSRSAITSGMFTSSGSEYLFFMIPQDLSGVKVRVTFQKRPKSGEPLQTVTRTVSLSGEWEAGMYYTYKISAWINVVGEELHFIDPKDQNGNSISGNITFNSRSDTAEDQYIQTINLSGVKYIRMTWSQSWKNADKAAVAQLYLYDPANKTEITTQTKGNYSYGGTMYNGIYDAKAKGFPTTGSWVFKLDGEFKAVACCFTFLNSGSGGNSSTWTVSNVANIKFEVLELMP